MRTSPHGIELHDRPPPLYMTCGISSDANRPGGQHLRLPTLGALPRPEPKLCFSSLCLGTILLQAPPPGIALLDQLGPGPGCTAAAGPAILGQSATAEHAEQGLFQRGRDQGEGDERQVHGHLQLVRFAGTLGVPDPIVTRRHGCQRAQGVPTGPTPPYVKCKIGSGAAAARKQAQSGKR